MLAPLDRLRRNVERCERCPELVASRQRVVFGDGPPDARWMVVGEAPGEEEDKRGVPFIGRAGQKARTVMLAEGLDPDTAFWTNTILCHPPRNRDPHPDEIRRCWYRLALTIRLIMPVAILAFGLPATRTLLRKPELVRGKSMSELRGRPQPFEVVTRGDRRFGCHVFPTYHPAYILRPTGRPFEGEWRSDLRLVRNVLEATR